MQPSSCALAKSIAALSPAVPAGALVAVLLGIEPAKEVETRTGDRTLRCVLTVADASRPTGIEITVWGTNALRLAYLRPLQIIHIPWVTLRNRTWTKQTKTTTTEIIHTETPHKIRHLLDDIEDRCDCAKSQVAKDLALWNHTKHGELTNVVLSARPPVGRIPIPRNAEDSHLQVNRKRKREQCTNADENGQVAANSSGGTTIRWIRGVIKDVCIRAGDNTNGDGVEKQDIDVGKMLQKAVVKLCRTCKEKVLSTDVKCTKCMPLAEDSCSYVLDEEAVAVRLNIDEGNEKSVVARCAGEDLARLLLVDEKELMESNEARDRAGWVLRALSSDKSEFEIAVEDVGREVRLRTLRF